MRSIGLSTWLFFPLWLRDMPALLKGFLEQVAPPGFAFSQEAKNPLAAKGPERPLGARGRLHGDADGASTENGKCPADTARGAFFWPTESGLP